MIKTPTKEEISRLITILLTNGHEISYPRPLGIGL
jgi:hypothetical protein